MDDLVDMQTRMRNRVRALETFSAPWYPTANGQVDIDRHRVLNFGTNWVPGGGTTAPTWRVTADRTMLTGQVTSTTNPPTQKALYYIPSAAAPRAPYRVIMHQANGSGARGDVPVIVHPSGLVEIEDLASLMTLSFYSLTTETPVVFPNRSLP